jgi:hypothetical protein
MKDRIEHWCKVLGIKKEPKFVFREKSYYWSGICVLDLHSKNIDHDIIHELVHFKDDQKVSLDLISEAISILRIIAIAGIFILLFGNSIIGSALILLFSITKASRDLLVEGRAEYHAIRLAGSDGRIFPFFTLIFFNLCMLAACSSLIFFIWMKLTNELIHVLFLSLIVIFLFLLSCFSSKILV